jgi:hypothetical protein
VVVCPTRELAMQVWSSLAGEITLQEFYSIQFGCMLRMKTVKNLVWVKGFKSDVSTQMTVYLFQPSGFVQI